MDTKKERYIPKTLAIIAFVLVFVCLGAAITLDIVIFFEKILSFIFAIFAPAFMFFIFFIGFILSLFLVFGFYIYESNGFWPLTLSIEVYKSITGDVVITPEQIQIYQIGRSAILVFAFLSFILAIISSKMDKNRRKRGDLNVRRVKPFNVITIIFSILGIIVGFGVLLIIRG
jgi:hypothetical protein